jgi:hypothetical protein
MCALKNSQTAFLPKPTWVAGVIFEAGGWRLEAGGWRLEAGGWRLEG